MDGLAIQSNAASVGNVHSVGKFAKTSSLKLYLLHTVYIGQLAFLPQKYVFFFFIVDEISFFMPIKQTKPGQYYQKYQFQWVINQSTRVVIKIGQNRNILITTTILVEIIYFNYKKQLATESWTNPWKQLCFIVSKAKATIFANQTTQRLTKLSKLG